MIFNTKFEVGIKEAYVALVYLHAVHAGTHIPRFNHYLLSTLNILKRLRRET